MYCQRMLAERHVPMTLPMADDYRLSIELITTRKKTGEVVVLYSGLLDLYKHGADPPILDLLGRGYCVFLSQEIPPEDRRRVSLDTFNRGYLSEQPNDDTVCHEEAYLQMFLVRNDDGKMLCLTNGNRRDGRSISARELGLGLRYEDVDEQGMYFSCKQEYGEYMPRITGEACVGIRGTVRLRDITAGGSTWHSIST